MSDTGSGPCTVAGYEISSVESLAPDARELLPLHYSPFRNVAKITQRPLIVGLHRVRLLGTMGNF